MTIDPMPAAEPPLVRGLLSPQHPGLAGLPLTPVGNGWDKQLYRLGDDFLVRLPRRRVSAPLIEHEWHNEVYVAPLDPISRAHAPTDPFRAPPDPGLRSIT